jgi:integrase
VRHRKALPYAEVPGFIQALRACGSDAITKLAFEFLILTATRGNETREAPWVEIHADRWVIPKERMKGKAQHVVPLPSRCLGILEEVRGLQGCHGVTGLIFPSQGGKPLSDMTFIKVLRSMGLGGRATAHGFRSSFSTWCAETHQCREVVAEAALAHTIKDKTEAAYRRTSFLEERVGLMERWCSFCTGDPESTVEVTGWHR